MKLKKILIGIAVILLCVIGVRTVFIETTPEIENLKLRGESFYVPVGQTIEVVKDLEPDPAFLRLVVKSSDESIAQVQKDKFSIKGISHGTVTISFYDKNKLISTIELTVVD